MPQSSEARWRRSVEPDTFKECSFAYFVAPFLLPSDHGIPCRLLPTFDTQYEGEFEVPPVVRGPILVSVSDLNGYEFGI